MINGLFDPYFDSFLLSFALLLHHIIGMKTQPVQIYISPVNGILEGFCSWDEGRVQVRVFSLMSVPVDVSVIHVGWSL